MPRKKPIHPEKKDRIYKSSGGICYICERPLIKRVNLEAVLLSTPPNDWEEVFSRIYTLDHVKPRSQGGKTSKENLKPACVRCHYLKDQPNSDPNGWKNWVRKGFISQKIRQKLNKEGLWWLLRPGR